MIKRLTALALAVMLLLLFTPELARAEDFTLGADFNFGRNTLHRDRWNRIEVHAANNRAQDLQGYVVIEHGGGEYIQDVFIEAGKIVTVVFFLPPLDVADNWGHQNHFLRISIRDTRDREQFARTVNAGISQGTYIGVLGRNASNFDRVGNLVEDSEVVGMAPRHLDNLLFAQNLSLIIISDPGSISLSPVQQENLRRWVEMGGVLVIGGGSGWRQTSALVPGDMLPVVPRGVDTLSGSDLAALQLPVDPQGDFTAAIGDIRGKVLMGEDVPLVASSMFGQGAVLWCALDLEAAPLVNQANAEAFWEQLLLKQPLRGVTAEPRQNWAVTQLFNNLSQDSFAKALSPGRILLLLLFYIILIGPVNWLVLRKFDRREWAWVTVPLLSILFTTGTFAAGSLGRGNERVLYQVNIIDVYDNMAGVRSLSGVFVPRRGEINLKLTAAGVMATPGATVSPSGTETKISFANPALWSVQRWYAVQHVDLSGNFDIKVRPSGPNLEVMVANNTGQSMFESYIRMGNRWYYVGELAVGESKTQNLSPQHGIDMGQIFSHYSIDATLGRHWFSIDQLLPDLSFAFIGFNDGGVMTVEGAGRPVALNMWVQQLETIDFPPGVLNIPDGMLTPTIVGQSQDHMRHEGERFFEGRGSFDLIFSMPRNVDYTQGEYRLNFTNIWGSASGAVEVYNHHDDQWQEIADINSLLSNANRSITLEDPGNLVRENRLTVRVNYDGHIGLSSRGIDITVKGGRIND